MKSSKLRLAGLGLRWEEIDWAQVQRVVSKYQREIYSASKLGRITKVRQIQRLLFNSFSSKLLAVRRVTQDNRGKRTAGIDKVSSISPSGRLALAKALHIPTKATPLRRVWIPKPGKVEKRPLGIPILKDRALQAYFKLALEPEWEARFEENSYGFRPGRSAHDAVAAVKAYLIKRPKYIVDADIAKCFDRISHSALLDKIGMTGKYRKQILYWLKSGVVDRGQFTKTDMGTPQGGVISPLLANIALHGMETHLKKFVSTLKLKVYGATGKSLHSQVRKAQALGVVRYADDFVIIHHDRRVALACLEEVKNFLSPMGLEISAEKTSITHSLKLGKLDTVANGFSSKVGFDFLGFTFRQFTSKFRSAKSTRGTDLGFYTLVYPSKKTVNNYQKELHDIVLKKGMNQYTLIKVLNPIVVGWSRYFGLSDANTFGSLHKMDYLLYLKVRKWAKRVYGTTGKGTVCFKRIGRRKWSFVAKDSKLGSQVLAQHIDYSSPINKYVRVRGDASPFDGNHVYWATRLSTHSGLSSRVSRLLKLQKGICPWCRLRFIDDGTPFEVDHIQPLRLGGKDVFDNLQLLHGYCHDQKTAAEPK